MTSIFKSQPTVSGVEANIPSHIKTLVKNNKQSSKTSQFLDKDTALFYSFTGLKVNDITDYFAKQNGLSMKDLTKTDPKLGLIYNKLVMGLGQDYAINVSGVKPGMIPIPLATVAVEVKSEEIIKGLITDQLSDPIKNGLLTKMSKTLKGTEITTLITTIPGLTPGYMFHKGYLFVSTDVAELIKIVNTTDENSLKENEAFKKVTASDKALYQTTYINGDKLFGTAANTVAGLVPLVAQSPSDQILYNKLIIPILKALKNVKTIGGTSEATSVKELTNKSKIYVK